MIAIVAEGILHEIRRDGFSVGEHKLLDVLTGEISFHLTATNAKTGERWSVNALDEYA